MLVHGLYPEAFLVKADQILEWWGAKVALIITNIHRVQIFGLVVLPRQPKKFQNMVIS